MPQPRKPKPAASKAASGSPFPPTSALHVALGGKLVERMIREGSDLFVQAAQDYRARHRAGTSRPLTAMEAAQVTAAWSESAGLPPVTLAVAIQESDLRGYDEPDPREILLRAGVATLPEAMETVQRIVALIEIPAAELYEADETNTLDAMLDARVKELSIMPLTESRDLASRAFAHFAAAAGESPGKAWSLITKGLWALADQATSALGLQSASSSLTGSLPSTDGLAETSSPSPTS